MLVIRHYHQMGHELRQRDVATGLGRLHGFVGVVIPAVRANGAEVVPKLGFPLSCNAVEPVGRRARRPAVPAPPDVPALADKALGWTPGLTSGGRSPGCSPCPPRPP
ncbi:hypothetical protein AB0H12_10370 [Actinosynnema sp. NPDC023794]